MVCAYCHSAHLFRTNLQKLDSSISPLVPSRYPVGCCIHAFVATMKNPESQEPRKMRKAAHQWPKRLSFLSPKRNKPKKLDSRKKEKTPSIASVWPITPPAALENSAQFVPN